VLDGEVCQQGMTVPGHEDICKPERPVCNLYATKLSASVIGVGVARCGRTLMMRRQAMRWRPSPIASAVQGVMECQPTLHCNSPAAVAPDMTPMTGRQSQVPSDRCPKADVKLQNRQTLMMRMKFVSKV